MIYYLLLMKDVFMKVYIKIVLLITFMVVYSGFIMPYLISAKDDILVIIGFLSIGFVLPFLYYLLKSIVKDSVNLMKGDSDES